MRRSVLAAIRAATEPAPWAIALWEGGSASFDRLDEGSDLDIGLAVDDAHVADGFAAVEGALTTVDPIEATWESFPVTDIKPQRYYRLTSGLIVDVGVLPASTPPLSRFVDRRRHGVPKVEFDRAGWTDDVPVSEQDLAERLAGRRTWLAAQFAVCSGLALKSARRGEAAEAVAFYHAFVMRPIVELLRIRHDPWRHDFGVRYLRFDLPEPDRERVYRLWMVADLDALRAQHAEASAWFAELIRG